MMQPPSTRATLFAEPLHVAERIDAAYHAKYDRYGPSIVGSVVGDDTEESTLRVVAR